jgi:hypothetical protein
MDYAPDWSDNTIDFIGKVLLKTDTVFEWGTGYSTIWLAQRVKKVITMEHNPVWFDKIKALAKELKITNIDFNLHLLFNDLYYNHIHNCDGIDFIIVDGRNRMRCFNEAIKLGKPVMLDDSERVRYQQAFTKGLKGIDMLPTPVGQKATIFQ